MNIYNYNLKDISIRVLDIKHISEDEKAMMLKLLGNERREYALSIQDKNPAGCLERLAAGYLLEEELLQRGIDNRELTYLRSENGRPYIKEINLDFSLSHSGRFAACAIGPKPAYADPSHHMTFGIDIEDTLLHRNKDRLLNIAKRFFTEKEKKELLNSDEDIDLQSFLKLWTKKEAAAKASDIPGARMISAELSNFSFYSIKEYDYILTLCTGSSGK
ncbi:MAG: 4'-phosphopantetheinyl transferase superfamily protein [Lachnospiraceae bacterium]|nr:4'-phosphopantetheinyl transferase superfamily protein [Lachnospiraceae bacterium]